MGYAITLSILLFVVLWGFIIFTVLNQNILERGSGKGIFLCKTKKEPFQIRKKLNRQPDSKGILVVSLFGDLNDPYIYNRYVKALLKNVGKMKMVISGWTVRVYITPEANQKVINDLIEKGCEVYIMSKASDGMDGALWRFLAAAGDKPFLSIDADDKGFYNWKHVHKWLEGDKPFFRRTLAMLNSYIPICAGLWGGKANSIPGIKERISKYCGKKDYGIDEAFLSKEIWPLFKKEGYYNSTCGWDILFWILLSVGLFITIATFVYIMYIMYIF